MPVFIKTERFTEKTKVLLPEQKNQYLTQHKKWVQSLKNSGHNLSSGYLADEQGRSGGGGFLVLEAKNFETAKHIILTDPMIINNLVVWELQEWIPVSGSLLT